MFLQRTPLVLLACTLASACTLPFSEAPLATNFPTSKQQKLQTAAHWQAISADVARRLATELPAASTRPLFVAAQQETPFNRAVVNQLISWLVSHGYAVASSPIDTIKVEVDTQAVEFRSDRPRFRHAGMPTALAAGAWALSLPGVTAAGGATALIAASDAHAAFSSEFASGETPKTEIILNLSVIAADRYLARSTTVYYVADNDLSLYSLAPPARPSQTFAVKGD